MRLKKLIKFEGIAVLPIILDIIELLIIKSYKIINLIRFNNDNRKARYTCTLIFKNLLKRYRLSIKCIFR